MPAVLEAPKAVSKQEEFVEKQIEHARQRIRVLDWFAAGLAVLIGSLAFALTVLLLDRHLEAPAGSGWAALGIYLLAVGGYLYWSLFRPSRRQINPYYAARKVEQTIPDAKNSVVNYIDLKDDEQIPGSVKTAIGARAAKDLKHVDLNQVIQKRQILWLAGIAGVFFIATTVAAFLPPTRTTLALLQPQGGNAAIIQGNDLRIETEIRGRIPQKTEPDAPRVRLWYNPDDPATYEDRPLEQVEGQKRLFGVTIPAKQMRSGFHYKVLAGNAASSDFEVKVHILPQFTGWTIEYKYPDYLQKAAAKSDNPNLVGNYGTLVTLTALTNRPVKSGVIDIDGQVETIPGQLVADNPEAIRFRFPMLRNSTYRIRFVTTDDQRNPDPQRYRLALLDPNPAFLNFDVTYDYPKYLRFEPVTVTVRQANLEAMRGTKVTIVAHTNRPIKAAKLEFPGSDIVGTIDPAKPMQAKFSLPPLMQDGQYRVVFSPKTDESEGAPEVFNIRVLADEAPKVSIELPQEQIKEIAANGVLVVEGHATDDIGIDRMILRLEVDVGKKPLDAKPYRNGTSFRRESDNSYPTDVAYKDFVELDKVKADGASFRLVEGMLINYWLEAVDNCDVLPPGPQTGRSAKKQVKVGAPIMAPDKKKAQQQEQQKAQQDQKQHEQRQDQQNKKEKREPNQPQPKGDQQPPKKGEGGAQENPPKQQQGDPMPQPGMGGDMQPPMNGQPMQDENLQNDAQKAQQALEKTDPKNGMGGMADMNPVDPNMGEPKKQDPNAAKNDPPKQDPNARNDPPKQDPNAAKKDPPNQDPNAKNDPPKQDPNVAKKDPPKKDGMDTTQPPNADPLPKPEDVQDLADKLQSKDPKQNEEAREQLKQMMDQAKKDPPKPEEQQKKIDEFRNDLDKKEKEKFDQAMRDVQKEMQNLKREERARNAEDKAMSDDPKKREQGAKEMEDLKREERVQKAAEKAMSDDKQTREEGQKELEKELQNPNTRDDVDRQLQHMANDTRDPNKKQKLEDAKNLGRQDRKKQDPNAAPQPPEPMPEPKKEEEDVDRLAKKVQKGTPEEKKDAQDKLEQKLKDPAQHDKVQKQLDDIKNNIQDPGAKKNFEESMKKIQDNVAKKDNAPKEPNPKPEDIEKFANQLTSDNKQEREQAQKQLEEAMKQADKDPKSREQAEQKLKDVRDGIKDEKKKEQFDKAMDKIGKAVEQQRQVQQAKADKQAKDDAQQIAKDLNSNDPAKQKAAEQKLEDMLKDPKNRDAVKKELENAKKDPAAKDNIDKAIQKAEDNLAKKDGNDSGQPKKDDTAKKDGNQAMIVLEKSKAQAPK